MKYPEKVENITEPVVTPEDPVVDEKAPVGPMRGHDEFAWLKRALDPSSLRTKDNESIRTESRSVTNADGSTSEVLFPTLRQEIGEDGKPHLVRLESEDAFNRAMTEDDYLSFGSPEEATQYSTHLSDTIDRNRKDYNFRQQLQQEELNKQQAVPTPAILPQEVTQKYYSIAKTIDDLGNHEFSYESVKSFISAIEDQTEHFATEDGEWAEMDLLRTFNLPQIDKLGNITFDGKETTLLKELEKRFPKSNPSPGAELIKNYLRDKIDERDAPLKLPNGNIITNTSVLMPYMPGVAEGFKTVIGGTGREIGNVVMDIPAIAGNIGYSAGELIADTVKMIAYSPTYDVFTASNMLNGMSYSDATSLASKDAKELVEKIFKYKSYAGEKPQPDTMTGQMLAPMGEFGLSMMVGSGMYKWGSALLTKWKPLLNEGNLVVKQASKKAEKLLAPVLGGTLLQSPEHRLIPFLEDLGASGDWVDFIKDSPDDNEFMKRYKAFLDTSFEATGFNLFMPTLLLMGRTAYNYGKPVAQSVMDTKGDALTVASKWWDKIKYLFPKQASERVMHPARKAAQSGKLADIGKVKDEAMSEVQKLLAASKDGSLEAIIKSKGYKIDEKGLVVQDKLVTRTTPEDKINIDIVKVGDEKLKLKDLTKKQKVEVAEQTLKSADDLANVPQDIFNVSKISSDDARHKYIQKAAVIFESIYKQGTKANKETIAEAEKIRKQVTAWVGEENVGEYLKKFGDISTSFPAHMAATRQYLLEETKHFVRASDKIAKIREAGDPSKQELAEYFLDMFKYLGAMETDVKIAGNIARTLQVRNNILASSEVVLDSILKGASAGGSTGKENLMDIAKMISHQEDPLGIANIVKRKGPLYNLFETIKSGSINGMLSNAMTQTAANMGIMSYAITTQFENIFSASLNAMTREFSKRTGSKILGKGHGMTFGAVNASNFGMSQSLFEIFAGAHFGKRSPVGSAYRAGKNLQVDSLKHHELSDQLRTTGHHINLPWVGDVALSRGLNEEVFGEYLDTAFMKGDIGSVMKLMVNSAGLIQSAAGRAIVMTDGFWRNILERMELHKLSYIEATNIERKIAASAGGELTNDAIQSTYMYLIRNPDPKMLEAARDSAQTGLMQANPGKTLRKIEQYKNKTSDYRGAKDWIVRNKEKSRLQNIGQSGLNWGENAGKGIVNIVDNSARTFVASKFSFMRTMTNIYKQYVWERGIPKFLRQLHPDNAKRFMSDELYRQETLAKIGSGTMITSMGYTIGGKLKNELGEAEWFMEGVNAADPSTRFVKQATGTRSPEIMYKNEKGDIYSIPLDRLDPLKASMSLGAIFGSYADYWEESLALMDEGLHQDSIDMKQELSHKFYYALGDWVMDVPMMQGVKETAGNFIPGISPYGADPQKEAVQFLNNFINPWVSNYSSLRKAGHKIVSPFATISQKSEKYEYEEPIEDPEFIDGRGATRPDKRAMMNKKRTFLTKIMDEFQEATFKVAFMDRSGDNLRNPKVGQILYGLVGPEGNLVKFLPDTTLDSIERGLKTLAIPVFGKKQVRTNTSDLILGLRVDYSDPRRWNAGPGIVLNAEQRYAWTVEAGRLNKRLFNNSYFSSHVDSVSNGAINLPQNRRIKARLRKEVQAKINFNRAKALKMIMNLKKYPRNKELVQQIRFAKKQEALKTF